MTRFNASEATTNCAMDTSDFDPAHDIYPFPTDWDFDRVPDDEIIACCLWEYARESHTIEIAAAQSWLSGLRTRRSPSFLKMRPDLIVEEWEEREEKRLNEWLDEVGRLDDTYYDRLWQTDFPMLKIYDAIKSQGGPRSLPWLLLNTATRQSLVRKVGESSTLFPVGEALVCDLEEVWNQNSKDLVDIRSEERPEDDDSELMALYSPTSKVDIPGEDGKPSETTCVALTIDFSRFTDREITAAFKLWLKKHRPDRWRNPRRVFPNSPQRGKKLNDYRTALDRLGLVRLLHENYPAELRERFPEVWKRMCRDESHFRRECQLACDFFRVLFPFLPDDETLNSAEPCEVWDPRAEEFSRQWEEDQQNGRIS